MSTRFKSPEYITWDNMLQRCTNPNNPRYKDYGGRGITVCERWRSFENFLTDLGPKPSKAHTIERKDNEKGYCLENCCWMLQEDQAWNKRIYVNNTSGIKGVIYSKTQNLWRVKVEGLFIYNGKDFFEACCVRKHEELRRGHV